MRNHTRPDQIEDTPVSERRARTQTQCCWPKCQKPAVEAVPMCTAHLFIAHAQYGVILNGMTTFNPAPQQPAPEPITPAPPRHGVVYYLRSGGYIKIGWASDLGKRMRSYPPDSLLLATHPGTKADESAAHRKFAVHRTHGREWFAMVAPLMQHIDRVRAEHGEPDQVSFAAQPVKVPQPRAKQYVGGNYRGHGPNGARFQSMARHAAP